MNLLTNTTDLKWLYILLISLGAIIIVVALIFLIIYLVALKNKKASTLEAKSFYLNIVEAVGGIDNIVDVTVNSSRLNIILKDNDVLNGENFKSFVAENNIGTVKSSKKITMVIGEYASNYHLEIKKLLEK